MNKMEDLMINQREFYRVADIGCVPSTVDPQHVHAMWTGEERCPKQGEWFFRGSIIGAYKAYRDLSQVYPIAKLVETETLVIKVKDVEDPTCPYCDAPSELVGEARNKGD